MRWTDGLRRINMLYIKKMAAPKEMQRKVSEIKSSSEWHNIKKEDTKAIRQQFDLLPKDSIRKQMLKEQRYLCAYCMKKIANDGRKTTIEHWYPISKDKNRALDYRNMLAVCDGGRRWQKGKEENDKKRVLSCDAKKGDYGELKINPFNKQQMNLIAYNRNGQIYILSGDQRLEYDINVVLGLNGLLNEKGELIADTSTELVRGRRDCYQQYNYFIRKLDKQGKCTSEHIKKRMEEIEQAERQPEYAGVLLYFLKKKYNQLLKRNL